MSVYWHVMGDASDVIEYDRRRSRLCNATLHMKEDTDSIGQSTASVTHGEDISL